VSCRNWFQQVHQSNIIANDAYMGRLTTEAAVKAIMSGIDINHAAITGLQPLHYAVIHRQTELVECLLAYGAKTDVYGDHHLTPMHYVTDSALDILHLLLDAGASVNVASYSGETPFVRCILTSNVACARRIASEPSFDMDFVYKGTSMRHWIEKLPAKVIED
jgi:ankyrin repeat protein